MAGGMAPGGAALTLAERSALSRGEPLDAELEPALPGRTRPAEVIVGRSPRPQHCWVTGVGDSRCAGLLAEWSRRADDGQEGVGGAGWFGRVVYAVVDEGRVVLVEAWVPAAQLEPAG